jgi:RNA polymerase sigma-70 factor (ECF subfamily)
MSPDNGSSGSCFVTTHWSVVLSAKVGSAEQADAALEQLCSTYWWPLYAFVRRRGNSPHDAEDLVQEFFARLLAKDFLQPVDRTKGRFRSFLLAAMDNFLAKEWRRSKAQKRGGRYRVISLDAETAEDHYMQIPATTQTPEQIYDYQWGIKLFERVLNRLRDEDVAKGRQRQFDEIRVFLHGDRFAGLYAELAARLDTTEAALKMAVSRMKKRYGELLREEVAQTVSNPDDVEDELRALAAILSPEPVTIR